MGTNYYCNAGMKTVTCEYGHRHRVPNVLHIGKNSYGWVFMMQGYNDEDNQIKGLEDWKKVLKKSKEIYNEYGEKLSYDEMLAIIQKEGRQLSKQEEDRLKNDVEEMERTETMFHSKYIVKNGLIANVERSKQANAGPNDNFGIDFREFS